jgi:GrpB-like predicted nucleotidyltransferase (UPF0157 family)
VAGSDDARRTLAFRDHLRAHPDAAAQYAAPKRGWPHATTATRPRAAKPASPPRATSSAA